MTKKKSLEISASYAPDETPDMRKSAARIRRKNDSLKALRKCRTSANRFCLVHLPNREWIDTGIWGPGHGMHLTSGMAGRYVKGAANPFDTEHRRAKSFGKNPRRIEEDCIAAEMIAEDYNDYDEAM